MQSEPSRQNAFCCLMLVYHIRIPDYRYVIEVNRMKNGPDPLHTYTHIHITFNQSARAGRQVEFLSFFLYVSRSLSSRNPLWVVIL